MKKSNYFDDLDMGVITTVYVLHSNSKILNVIHYADGWWQFNGKENNVKDNDLKIVSLDEILVLDPSIYSLKNMKSSFEAKRESEKEEWKILPFKELNN